MNIYLDASAWVKRYLTETGDLSVQAVFDNPDHCLFASRLGMIEVTSSVSRQRTTRLPIEEEQIRFLLQIQDHWENMQVVLLTEQILETAFYFAWNDRLKGADSIHAAIVYHLNVVQNTPVALFCYDDALTAFALRNRLPLFL